MILKSALISSIAATLLVTMMACSGSSAKPDAGPSCDFTLEWGVRDGASFTAFGAGDDAEITLGFQGFRYITSSVKLVDITADEATLSFEISVDGHAPWAQTFGGPITTDGAYIDVLVFFNDIPIPELLGRTTTISARGIANGCLGSYGTSVTLKDDDNCLDTEDGGLECQDDTP